MDSDLTHETFNTHLNTRFLVDYQEQPIQMLLVEISELKKTERQEQFSIVFAGPSEPALHQGIHKFKHPAIGSFDLFIVPIRRDGNGYQYEAVFNRVTEAGLNSA